jgi:hypothetical protein
MSAEHRVLLNWPAVEVQFSAFPEAECNYSQSAKNQTGRSWLGHRGNRGVAGTERRCDQGRVIRIVYDLPSGAVPHLKIGRAQVGQETVDRRIASFDFQQVVGRQTERGCLESSRAFKLQSIAFVAGERTDLDFVGLGSSAWRNGGLARLTSRRSHCR